MTIEALELAVVFLGIFAAIGWGALIALTLRRWGQERRMVDLMGRVDTPHLMPYQRKQAKVMKFGVIDASKVDVDVLRKQWEDAKPPNCEIVELGPDGPRAA